MPDGMRPRPPISRLVRAGTALVVAAILATAAIAVGTIAHTARTADVVIDEIGPLRINNALLLRNLVDAETGLRGYQITQADDVLAPLGAAETEIPRLITLMREGAEGHDEWMGRVDDLAFLIDLWFTTHASQVVAQVAIDPASITQELVEEGKAIVDRARLVNAQLEEDLRAERERRRADLDDAAVRASGAIVVALLLALLAIVWRTRRVDRAVTRPLQELESAVVRLEAGTDQLEIDLDGAREVEHLGHALTDLAARNAALADANANRLLEERLVRHLTRRVREALGRDDVLERAAEVLGSASGAEQVVVFALAENRVGEVIAEWARPGRPQFGRGRRLPDSPELQHAVDELIRDHSTLVIDDVTTTEQLPPSVRAVLERLGIRAAVIAAAVAGDDAMALVAALSSNPTGPWSPLAATATTAVADDLATALTHARLYEREQEMVGRLRSLDQAKTDFVSSVSHELRTPLTSIRGYVEMLRDGEGGELVPEQDHMLAIVERNSERLLALIEDLLTLSRVESGTFRTTFVDVEVVDAVQSVVDALAPHAAARDVELVVDASAALPRLKADPAQLERALLNVITNAIKFSEDGGRVTVRTRSDHGVTIEVIDEGIGIPESEQGELFTRFFRSSEAQTRAIPGTGLGLVIVQSIVENHGGTVSIRSTPGTGTTVLIHLPAAPIEDPS